MDLLPSDLSSVWDVCCDHGLIGEHCLQLGYKVTFVDQVAVIMEKLSQKLKDSDIPRAQYQILHKDAKKIEPLTQEKTCFIVTGIGADLLIQIIDRLFHHNFYFLISAHQNNHKLRRFLREKKIKLIDEKLVCENKQYYEILLVHPEQGSDLSLVSSKLLDQELDEEAKNYIMHKYQLFKIKSRYDQSNQDFFDAYENLYLKA